MRFVFQKQSRTVVHTVNLCAKRVQCSKRNTIEAVGSPINRVECSCENTSQPMQRRYARGNARNVPVGTHRDTRSVLSVTARGFSVSAHGPDLFWRGAEGAKWFVHLNVPSGTLCKAIGRAQSGRTCVLQSSHFNSIFMPKLTVLAYKSARILWFRTTVNLSGSSE